jgi:hypothetical protein
MTRRQLLRSSWQAVSYQGTIAGRDRLLSSHDRTRASELDLSSHRRGKTESCGMNWWIALRMLGIGSFREPRGGSGEATCLCVCMLNGRWNIVYSLVISKSLDRAFLSFRDDGVRCRYRDRRNWLIHARQSTYTHTMDVLLKPHIDAFKMGRAITRPARPGIPHGHVV